jgi:hypothetical protein
MIGYLTTEDDFRHLDLTSEKKVHNSLLGQRLDQGHLHPKLEVPGTDMSRPGIEPGPPGARDITFFVVLTGRLRSRMRRS